ncbi:ligand-binding sensor domain-containing protein [Foetidibacter luteolus]|uniref:ligand-binding sensor domain-containing protein n=1 Tax=Foetidibacter luteolus TaxID=2608880 RepID=UPI00129B72B6|nr:two-component regulator propeller domain-containing protein [Foetidibacter luteolus]
MFKTIISSLCFVFIVTFCAAQQTQDYVFTHLTSSNGLSTNEITSIIQDKKGFVWLGTYNGLQRYDGSNFINFKNDPNSTGTVLENVITQLCEDGNGNIWILFGSGRVGVFNTMNFLCTEVALDIPEPAQMQNDRKLFKDGQGKVHLLIHKNNMYRFDERTRSFSSGRPTVKLPVNWHALSAYFEGRNRIWVGCDSGLVMMDIAGQTINYRGHNPAHNPVIKYFSSHIFLHVSLIDDMGRVWITEWPPMQGIPYLFEFNPATLTNIAHHDAIYGWLKGYHEIMQVMQQQDGTVWIGGNPLLAYKAKNSSQLTFLPNVEKNEFSLHYDYMNTIMEDREHNMWFATDRGVFIFNPARQFFKSVAAVPKGADHDFPVMAIKEQSDGEIWTGTWGGGVLSYNSKLVDNNRRDIAAIKTAWAICNHSSGNTWVGCQGGEIYIYSSTTRAMQHLKPKLFNERTITGIAEDKKNNLWFCLYNGTIIKWDVAKAQKAGAVDSGFVFIQDFTGSARKIICDSSGYIWVTTEVEGIKKFDPVTHELLESYSMKGPQESRLLALGAGDIMQYNDSLMLFTEMGIGILNTRTKKIKHITSADGLPTNSARGIIKDKDGILWITSLDNLCRYNYEKNFFSVYSTKDGLVNSRFTLAVHEQLRDGRIILGTEHSIITFSPAAMARETKAPSPVITEILVNNSFVHVDATLQAGKLKLSYKDNSLMILFTALRYLQQEKLIFFHQLEGLDKDWVRTDIRNEAVYNYLKPGTYLFKVKCQDENGNVSGVTSFTVQVVAPFWQTNWFYGLLILVGVAVFYWIDRERIKRIFSLEQVRTQIAQNLYNEMSKTLNDINILSEISRLKADKDIERSKEYIDQINTKSKRMIEVMDDMLWSIDPANDNMEKTMARFGEQTEGLSTSADTPVELIVDSKVKDITLDMITRHELLILYKEALQIILQYPTGVPVIVNIELRKGRLSIIMHTVIEKHYYEHLHNSADYSNLCKRAKELKAEVDLQIDRNHAAIIVQLPLKF